MDFSYAIFPVKKINVRKILKLWENRYLIILSIHILKLEISGCDIRLLLSGVNPDHRRRPGVNPGANLDASVTHVWIPAVVKEKYRWLVGAMWQVLIYC
jgi:hypothetical protein